MNDFGNVVRQALDFDFAGDDLVQPALQFHAHRFAMGVHRHLDDDLLAEVDPLQVDVQQRLFKGSCCQSTIMTGRLRALDVKVENRVVARGLFRILSDFLRAYGNRHRILACPVNDRGTRPRTRNRRASFLPRVSRGSAVIVISFLICYLSVRRAAPAKQTMC